VNTARRNELRVGLTVLVGLAILFLGISYVKEWSLTDSHYRLTLRFPASAGLQTGDRVSVNGVPVGKVDAVSIDGPAVRVDVLIARDVTLWSDASARIQMLELMGGKQVALTRGRSGVPLDRGTVLEGTLDPDIPGALELAGQLGGDARRIARKADSVLSGANALLGDPHMVGALRETIENMRAVSSDLRSILAENRATIGEIAERVALLARRTDTLLADARPALSEAAGTAKRLAGRTDTLVRTVQDLVDDVRSSRGLVHAAIHDTTLVRRVDALLQRLDSLTRIIVGGDLRVRLRIF
jgi:phospholipid/cholesterol/gamma-HCH transport system substrate-binding protein